MPPGKDSSVTSKGKSKIRPSSAAANLQTHPSYTTGVIDNVSLRPATAAGSRTPDATPVVQQRPATQAAGSRRQWQRAAKEEEKPSDIHKQPRRLTLSTVDGIAEGKSEQIKRPGLVQGTSAQVLRSKIEERINIDTLEELKKRFSEADVNKNGKLELEEFKALMKAKLAVSGNRETQIDSLFMKIDWASIGSITWDEFCTYMQLEYAEKEDSYLRAKDVAFHLPAKIESIPHRDPVLRIRDTPEGNFVACSQDGMVSFWSPSLELKRTRHVVNIEQNVRSTKNKWITDFVLMPHYTKFIVGTGDREIQFFEQSSFEPYCQISGLDTVPLKLDYCATGHDECLILFGDNQGCINILVIKSAGECLRTWKKLPKHDGFIASISLNDAINSSNNNVDFKRWSVHGDWVQQLRYYHDISQVISCSNHSNTALVIGSTTGSTHVESQLKEIKDQQLRESKEQKENKDPGQEKFSKNRYSYGISKERLEADQAVFKVYKGVKCFDFSKDKNIIVTGGMDRIVRLWNPYVSGKPTALLRGHSAPIFFLLIAEEENRIFSLSTDKCIKVWDIQDHTCLLTVRPKGHKIRGDLQACHYSNISKTVCVATDQMAVLNLKLKFKKSQLLAKEWALSTCKLPLWGLPRKSGKVIDRPDMTSAVYCGRKITNQTKHSEDAEEMAHRPVLHADIVISHKEPVTCCMYNPSFKQVVTCSESSVIKLWDFETGTPIFEYGEAHGDSAITCMTFDNCGRRLITGGRDGMIRIWNYNNGHCLKVLQKEDENEEICDLTYVEMHRNKYIVAVGWDRRINIYTDDMSDSNIHHIQHPIDKWTDDVNRGHKEDILAVAQCPNIHLLATASYDGQVIVWNMVSGHIFAFLDAGCPPGYEDLSLDGDLSVSKLLFLHTRAYKKDAASLISSGPRGHIHFWNVFQGGKLMSQFLVNAGSRGAMVSSLAVNKLNTVLIGGDSYGFIYIWNIDGYCSKEPTSQPPELTISWRGHVKSVTSLTMVEEHKILLSSSVDCTVRMWNMEGHYIGTFGQPDPWDIYNSATFHHPMVPYDVLIDPMSLPSHPVVAEKQNMHQIIHEDMAKTETEGGGRTPTPPMMFNKQQFQVDDETIAAQIQEKSFKKGTGKRLRHEKLRPVKVDRGGPSEYQMLRCEDLADTPTPKTPTLNLNKDDPFNFSVLLAD